MAIETTSGTINKDRKRKKKNVSSNYSNIQISISSTGICRFKRYKKIIPEQCCAGRLDIKEVVIPIKIERIKGRAFEKCLNLNHVIFERGNNLNGLGEKAFSETAIKILDLHYCSNIIILPDQLCMNCKDLEAVFLPDGISIIGMECFSGCSSLKNVYYLGKTEPRLENGVFDNCEGFNGLEPIESDKIYSIIQRIKPQKDNKNLSTGDVWTIAAPSIDAGENIAKAKSATNRVFEKKQDSSLEDKKQ